jgi:uncharacterized protein (DUF433 family)/DNA-binding transcriptional MerR regulator
VAYTTKMAAALSGATHSQLRHWRAERTGPLLAPEIAPTPQALYSFRDLLALRTFVHLREHTSLQKIRAATGNLHALGETEHLGCYRLVADSAGNVQLVADDEALSLGKQPGQRQLLVVISKVIEPFPVRGGVVIPDLLHPRDHLAVNPGTLGGVPVIDGTRVPYDAVANLMRDNVPPEKIADYYPAVSADAARDALDFAQYVDERYPARLAA